MRSGAIRETCVEARRLDGSWAPTLPETIPYGTRVRPRGIPGTEGTWVGVSPAGVAWVCWGKWAPERAAHVRTQLERLRARRGHARRAR